MKSPLNYLRFDQRSSKQIWSKRKNSSTVVLREALSSEALNVATWSRHLKSPLEPGVGKRGVHFCSHPCILGGMQTMFSFSQHAGLNQTWTAPFPCFLWTSHSVTAKFSLPELLVFFHSCWILKMLKHSGILLIVFTISSPNYSAELLTRLRQNCYCCYY
jgi:hypothetical protein